MNCGHPNPAGYLFCGRCGEALDPVRCRCGFVVAAGDLFCGRCGRDLAAAESEDHPVVVAADDRLDLELLMELSAQEKLFLETTHKARVTQDDIRKLLLVRRKKF